MLQVNSSCVNETNGDDINLRPNKMNEPSELAPNKLAKLVNYEQKYFVWLDLFFH